MKRIAPRRPVYRTPSDPRRESVRLGKYIYLTLLIAFLAVLGHVLIGHLYVLRGDGFVLARQRAVALPFEAMVEDVMVADGARVRAGERLFHYVSVPLLSDITELRVRLADLERRRRERAADLEVTAAELEVLEDYVARLTDMRNRLDTLREQGLAENERYGDVLRYRLQAARDLAGLRADRTAAREEVAALQETIARLRTEVDRLRDVYGDGTARAPRDGVVAGLDVVAGEVLEPGREVLRVFSGRRYLGVFFESASLVGAEPGDPVLVDLPGRTLEVGRIADLRAVSPRLPAEFQPRFKPADRDRLAVVLLPPGVLQAHPVLSTVNLYKPVGLEWLVDPPEVGPPPPLFRPAPSPGPAARLEPPQVDATGNDAGLD
ncbi:HlyD family secretion protein [Caenispirillum salinarum]|uniref:HlyD family secretion protein n=1 Tax=Caenispirillum salinarum TaxID=859058 RepID=UPI00384BF125